ncbi:MAG: thiamine pyrophosphate-binding protein, partial [Proteobacteria bacterium]|nr:thiamine pyrophosphate-binding protein [Pseudomonadota bacterium]
CDFDPASISQIEAPRPAPSASDISRVMELLSAAKRPVLVAGGGVARSGATAAFRQLLDLTGLPATTSMNGRGIIPADYPAHVGSGGILGGEAVVKVFAEADLVLAVGCKISSWMPLNKPPLYPSPPGQKLIQVDMSERVTGRNMKADIAILADAREFLEALSAAVDGASLAADPDWIAEMASAHAEYRGVVAGIADAKFTEGTKILNEAAATREIISLLPDDVIVAVDGGQIMEWVHTFYHPASPEDVLFNPGMGHLGMGLPAANAAKAAHPDRPVVCITGDGAMGCTVQELETAVRYGLNVITFVLNDSHWGMYRPLGESILSNNPLVFGTKLGDVDFGMVARGFGCHGDTVTTLEEIPEAYEKALASGKPAVINVIVDFTPHPIDAFWVGYVLEGANLIPPEMMP